MRTRTLAAAGAVAIALFAASATVPLWTASDTAPVPHRGETSSDAPARDGAAAPAGAPLSRPEPLHAPEDLGPPGTAAVDASPAPPRPEDLDPSWRDSPVASRVRQLGAVGPYVYTGLRDVRAEMSFCFESEAARSPPAATEPSVEPAALVLYLEAREGGIDIVEVGIDRLGTLPREAVECCREVLRGHALRAPGAVPGRRYRLTHLLP